MRTYEIDLQVYPLYININAEDATKFHLEFFEFRIHNVYNLQVW